MYATLSARPQFNPTSGENANSVLQGMDMGKAAAKPTSAVESRDLQFADGQGGSVLVYDASNRELIDTIAPGTNGFVRVVLRGLARERKLGDIGAEPPFRLTRYANGQMMLTDTSSNKQIDLAAFGAANALSFSRLMTMKGAT